MTSHTPDQGLRSTHPNSHPILLSIFADVYLESSFLMANQGTWSIFTDFFYSLVQTIHSIHGAVCLSSLFLQDNNQRWQQNNFSFPCLKAKCVRETVVIYIPTVILLRNGVLGSCWQYPRCKSRNFARGQRKQANYSWSIGYLNKVRV